MLEVVADDFGFGLATSRGIVRAHQAGAVTATSLMTVTGEYAAASVDLLPGAPKLRVGLHLVFSGPPQKPLVAGRSSGLVDRSGCFHPLPKLLVLSLFRKLDPAGIYDEICAQAEQCRKLLGREPAHVDGHHHAHQLPVIREALVRAVQNQVLPWSARSTVETLPIRRHVRGEFLRRSIMHRLGTTARPLFQSAGLQLNDSCFGMIGARDFRRAFPWEHYLPHVPSEGLHLMFVHPGEPDDSLAGRDSYIAQRPLELDALIRHARMTSQ